MKDLDETEIVEKINYVCEKLELTLKIKLHPRSPKDKYSSIEVFNFDMPWEIFLLFNDNNIGNLILCSVNSTAIYSAYLLFGRDVPAISLAQLILNNPEVTHEETREILKNSIDFTSKFQKTFPIESIIMPSDTDQLIKLLTDYNM